MNADAFDRLVRFFSRRGTRRAALVGFAALPFARARPASAQVCAPVGGLCTASFGCCDGTPCPMNLNAWVGICLAASATTAPATATTAAQGTGTSKDGVPGGQRRVPDDGNALGNRAKMRKRRRSHRNRKQKRRKNR